MNNNRLTYYTPNNPDSSRSHLLIKIKYTTQENEERNITLADLAGLEAPIKLNDHIEKGFYKREERFDDTTKKIEVPGTSTIKISNKLYYYPKGDPDLTQVTLNQLNQGDTQQINFKTLRPSQVGLVVNMFENTQKILKKLNADQLIPLFLHQDDRMNLLNSTGNDFSEKIIEVKNLLSANKFKNKPFYINSEDENDIQITNEWEKK